MNKCKHEWTPIAPDDDLLFIWEWCIRCGALKLDTEIFQPGASQQLVITSDQKETE